MRRLLLLSALITIALIIWSSAAGQEPLTSQVVLSPLTISLRVDESATASATAYDELGHVIPDAVIQWLPSQFDLELHCVSVTGGVITGRLAGKCGVGALTVTAAGRVILHQTPISVTVMGEEPSPSPSATPSPTVTPTATPTPTQPCSTRLPNGKCKRGCVCS